MFKKTSTDTKEDPSKEQAPKDSGLSRISPDEEEREEQKRRGARAKRRFLLGVGFMQGITLIIVLLIVHHYWNPLY